MRRMAALYPWLDGFFGARRLGLLAVFALVSFVAETILLPIPAHADDQSYLDGLAAEGVPINPLNSQAGLLQRGDAACRLLKAHVPPDQVAGQLGFNGWMWNQKIVDVAQRELCP